MTDLRAKSVLIVENEADVRASRAVILELEVHRVLEAAGGARDLGVVDAMTEPLDHERPLGPADRHRGGAA